MGIINYLWYNKSEVNSMPTYYHSNGIRIEMRLRENGHNEPHVHAIYANENMSVSIMSGEILSGYIANNKARREALKWIQTNRNKLLKEWRKYHV